MAGQADGRILVDSAIDPDGFIKDSKTLQSEAKRLGAKVEALGSTFQKALGGNPRALETFQAKAADLRQTVDRLAADLVKLGAKRAPTDAYKDLSTEAEKAGEELQKLLDKQEKMERRGKARGSKGTMTVSGAAEDYKATAAYKNLQSDIAAASARYDELIAKKTQLETTGAAWKSGTETAEYQGMSAAIDAANARLSAMRERIEEASKTSHGLFSVLQKIPSPLNIAKSVFSGILRVAKSIGSAVAKVAGGIVGLAKTAAKKLLSAFKSVLSTVKKMFVGNKSLSGSVGDLTSALKRMAPAMLAARGVIGILRKAVDSFLSDNEQVSNQMQACWNNLGNVLGPIITRIVSLVSTVTAYVTAFLRLLGFTAGAVESAGDAAGGAASKAEKAIKNLSGLDELNTWQSQNDGSGGGGGGVNLTPDVNDVVLPDWVKLVAEQLRSGEWKVAAKTLTDKLNEMVDGVDWPGLGDRLGAKIAGVLKFLADSIRGFDFTDLFTGLFTTLKHAIDKLDAEDLGTLLAAKFILIFSALQGAVESGVIPTVAKKLGGAIEGFFKTIREKFNDESDPDHGGWYVVGKNLGAVIGQIINSVAGLLSGGSWNQIAGDVGEFWSGLWEALRRGSNAPDWGALFIAIQTACKRLLARMLQWLPQSGDSKKTWKNLESRLEKDGRSVPWDEIFRALWDTLTDLAGLLIENLPSPSELSVYWDTLRDKLAEALGYADWDSLTSAFTARIAESIKPAIDAFLDYLYAELSASHPTIADWLFPGRADIEKAAGDFGDTYKNNFDAALVNLSHSISEKKITEQQALEIIAQFTGTMYGSMGEVREAYENGLIQPVEDGARDGAGRVDTAAREMAKTAPVAMLETIQSYEAILKAYGENIGAASPEAMLTATLGYEDQLRQGGAAAGDAYLQGLISKGDLSVVEAAKIATQTAAGISEKGTAFAEAAGTLADTYIGKLQEKVSECSAAGAALGDASAGAAKGVSDSAAEMSSAAETAAATVPTAIESEQDAVRAAGDSLGNAATEGASEGIEGFEDAVSRAIEGSAGQAGAGAQALRSRVHNEIRPLRPEVAAEFEGMGSDMSDSFSTSSSSVGSVVQSMAATVKQILSLMQRDLMTVLASMKATVTTNMTRIKTTSTINWASIKTTALDTGTAIKNSVLTNWQACQTSITEHMSSAASKAEAQWAKIRASAENANTGIKSSVSSNWTSIASIVTSHVGSVKNTVSSTFTSLINSAYSWGSDFGSQLASGIRSSISRIASAASSAAATPDPTCIFLSRIRGRSLMRMSMARTLSSCWQTG